MASSGGCLMPGLSKRFIATLAFFAIFCTVVAHADDKAAPPPQKQFDDYDEVLKKAEAAHAARQKLDQEIQRARKRYTDNLDSIENAKGGGRGGYTDNLGS